MKFTIQVYEQLTELVRQNPCLYDSSSPQNKDRCLKTNTWSRIAKEMGKNTMTGEDWKKLWRQKRDAFMRKRRELKNCPSGSAAKTRAKMPLYDQMSFLVSSVSNLDQETQQSMSDEETTFTDDSIMSPETARSFTFKEEQPSTNDDITIASSSWSSSTSNSFHSNKRRQQLDTALDSVLQQINDRSNLNLEVMKRLASRENEDNENVFSFIAKKFNGFTPSTRSWLEDEAMKLYMEAKKRDLLPSLQPSSSQPNMPTPLSQSSQQ